MTDEPALVRDLIDAGWYCSAPGLAGEDWCAWTPWDRRDAWEATLAQLDITMTGHARMQGTLTRGDQVLDLHLVPQRRDVITSYAHAVVAYDDAAGAPTGRRGVPRSVGLAELSRLRSSRTDRDLDRAKRHHALINKAVNDFYADGDFWGPLGATSDVAETLATLLHDLDLQYFQGRGTGMVLLDVLLDDPSILTSARLLTNHPTQPRQIPAARTSRTAPAPAAMTL